MRRKSSARSQQDPPKWSPCEDARNSQTGECKAACSKYIKLQELAVNKAQNDRDSDQEHNLLDNMDIVRIHARKLQF